MQIIKTKFQSLFVIKKEMYKDNRGFFYRDYCLKELKNLKFKIKQTNLSYNKKKYTLRGFHMQRPPYGEMKIISCLYGEIYNVSIDLRKKSDTYLKCFKIKLSEKNHISVVVPKGFANAYLTLKDNTKVLYYMSNVYKPSKEYGFKYDDEFFSVKWPYKPKVISKKDLNLKDFDPNE